MVGNGPRQVGANRDQPRGRVRGVDRTLEDVSGRVPCRDDACGRGITEVKRKVRNAEQASGVQSICGREIKTFGELHHLECFRPKKEPRNAGLFTLTLTSLGKTPDQRGQSAGALGRSWFEGSARHW
jgi:hypothetical protein